MTRDVVTRLGWIALVLTAAAVVLAAILQRPLLAVVVPVGLAAGASSLLTARRLDAGLKSFVAASAVRLIALTAAIAAVFVVAGFLPAILVAGSIAVGEVVTTSSLASRALR